MLKKRRLRRGSLLLLKWRNVFLTCECVCYGEYAGDKRRNYTADIGVLGFLVNEMADKHRKRNHVISVYSAS